MKAILISFFLMIVGGLGALVYHDTQARRHQEAIRLTAEEQRQNMKNASGQRGLPETAENNQGKF